MNAGLATVPDELEAQSALAEAGFQLESAVGQVDIARGDLLAILGARPLDPLQIQALSDMQVPLSITDAPADAIDRALAQRPERLQRAAEERAAAQDVRGARSAYFPNLVFGGLGGEQRLYGQQDQLPGVYQGLNEAWNVSLTLQWNIFDGGWREAELARSRDQVRQAQAETKRTEDDVEQASTCGRPKLQNLYASVRSRPAPPYFPSTDFSPHCPRAPQASCLPAMPDPHRIVNWARMPPLLRKADIANGNDRLTGPDAAAFRDRTAC